MVLDTEDWAENIFGDSELGDPRRTKRLIKIASNYASHVGLSTVKSCEGDESEVEAAYRFIRNSHIAPESIRESGFCATAKMALEEGTLLGIEDTTTISYRHSAADELGYTSNNLSAKSRGFNVHSILLLSQENGKCIGLIEQSWSCRDDANFGQRNNKRNRPYHDKESYKWEQASRNMTQRLGSKMVDVISICDREADIYNYLHYKLTNNQRFIVRARENRKIISAEHKLFEKVLLTPALGTYNVKVQQKGGRKARIANVQYHSATVDLTIPRNQNKAEYSATLRVNVVAATELNNTDSENKLEWFILTSEPIDTAQATRKVISCYELRWRIEDYHKAWKSGVGVEKLRLQSRENLERVGSIFAFIAVRLLQIREIALANTSDLQKNEVTVNKLLTTDEWKVLWITTQKSKPPKKPPSIKWAYQNLGKLGGWYDSKRTGIVGWQALWKGWFRLMDKVEAHNDAKLYA